MEKLLAIQAELKAPKDLKNTFGGYMYRSCESILEEVKPFLKKHGLVLILSDDIVEVGNRVYVKATATLFDNQKEQIRVTAFAREEDVKKGMDSSQITGAASSYARKYALNGLFLIDDNRDSDSTNQHEREIDDLKVKANASRLAYCAPETVRPAGPLRKSAAEDLAATEALKALAAKKAAEFHQGEAKHNPHEMGKLAPKALPAASQAPKTDHKTAFGLVTYKTKANKGGFVAYALEGQQKDDGKDMMFSTRDPEIIKSLDGKLSSGEQAGIGYSIVQNGQYTNYPIIGLVTAETVPF